MFEDLREAWREAVENFHRELRDVGGPVNSRWEAMRREIASARNEMKRLESELDRARRDAATERAEESVCRRREAAAERIGDEETVRLARSYAERYAARAAVLERKVSVLEAEREMRIGDLQEMEDALTATGQAAEAATVEGAGGGASSVGAGRSAAEEAARAAAEREIRRLEREARERAAEARLEELKRRMR